MCVHTTTNTQSSDKYLAFKLRDEAFVLFFLLGCALQQRHLLAKSPICALLYIHYICTCMLVLEGCWSGASYFAKDVNHPESKFPYTHRHTLNLLAEQ